MRGHRRAMNQRLALVTGVTGLHRWPPRAGAARSRLPGPGDGTGPRRLRDRAWYDDVEVVEADAGDARQLRAAMDGVDIAYYLIHSLGTGRRFEARDRHNALTFGTAAREAGVPRIVYLGGLYPQGEELSPHLDSRREVGQILLASAVPVTVLHAAVILGSGSASFEMLRHLTNRLAAMVTPRWLCTRIQPIAVRDVLHYLIGSASMRPT